MDGGGVGKALELVGARCSWPGSARAHCRSHCLLTLPLIELYCGRLMFVDISLMKIG